MNMLCRLGLHRWKTNPRILLRTRLGLVGTYRKCLWCGLVGDPRWVLPDA